MSAGTELLVRLRLGDSAESADDNEEDDDDDKDPGVIGTSAGTTVDWIHVIIAKDGRHWRGHAEAAVVVMVWVSP